MNSIEERNLSFYTEEGLEAMRHRLKSLADVVNKGKFPFSEVCLGFGKLNIMNEEEALVRIQELRDLCGFKVIFKKTLTKHKNGESFTKTEVITNG